MEDARAERRFDIVKPLGSGGFGAVYEAIDNATDKRVALKELTRVSPDALVRFKQEFRALADVHHPNLVSIKELIEQDGRWYLVMELIEGQDLIDFVRSASSPLGFDEDRLRRSFLGVARGLDALHSHGLLHRDLKPSNVRVTPEGRAVLLDFGLATSLDSEGQSAHVDRVGTVLYMAPEQLDGRKLGSAADWYAFGTCLFEALTGQRPFEGGFPLLIAHEKQTREPVLPPALASELPKDLGALSLSLLRIAADDRPIASTVLSILEGNPGQELHGSLLPPQAGGTARIFAGREAEIEHLERALACTDEGALRIVLVEGESGVGKSELVVEFLRQQFAREPRTLALRGRCYENEHVSYKAFDGCIDELSLALKRLGAEADALLPPAAGLLAQLFPVLGDVPGIRARQGSPAADPTARRLQAFAELSALLCRMAEDRPLILVIDDLQWADAESYRLLRALVEDPRPPPLLIVGTVRPRAELDADVLAQTEAVRSLHCVDVLPVTGLPRPQAERLAQMLLGPTADANWASIIALESRGHPLFLSELIHFSRSRDLSAHGSLTLDAALKARIERLPEQARALLRLVALAARPHRVELFADALGVDDLDDAVRVLLAAKLLRVRRDHELVCFHDRIRHVTASMIGSSGLPPLHRLLAQALERDLDADPTEQATHWDLGEASEHAVGAYERAADQALAALAFGQAERLYARALALLPAVGEQYTRLTIGRADALGFAGRSAEAAVLYQRAAELDVHEEQSLRLKAKTAQHLMLSGDVESGLVVCRQTVQELGMSLPRSAAAALLRAIWDRLMLRVRGLELAPTPAGDQRAHLALELISDLTKALAILRTNVYLALSGQHARRSVALASPAHAARAYANEGWLHCARGAVQRGNSFFERSRALCERSGDPAARALLAQQEGSSLVARWEFTSGCARLEEAERLYQAHVAHDPWSLTVTRYLLGLAWYRLGEHARLAQKMDLWIGEARERHDRVAVALLSGMGHGAVRHLRRGTPQEALRELEDAIAVVPPEPFAFAHLGHMISMQQALHLIGSNASWNWLQSRQRQLGKPQLLKTRFGREAIALLRTASALRACEGASAARRKLLLGEARKHASWLERRASPFTLAFAAHARAQAAALDGANEEALALARKARQSFAAIHYTGMHGAAYLEGLLEGGQAGAERCAQAAAVFREQGWVNPEHALTLLLTALPALKEQRGQQRSSTAQVVHHYELLKPLGSGGFGTVFEARDLHDGRTVALKELSYASARSLERFKQEFRALSDLNHTNLVRFDGLFEHQGRWFIAMELIRGQDLLSYVRPEGMLDAARLRQAFAGLLSGVSALHEAGFVHRDINPSNVCVTRDGRAVLLDFGLIARTHDAREAAPLGSADYAPPEQLEGSVPHPSADVYALGSCLYQALAGRLPYEPSPAGSISATKRARRPRALSAPKLRAVSALALRMLEPHPAERPSLAEVAATLSGNEPATPSQPAPLSLIPDASAPGSFSGRRNELSQLKAAFARARTGCQLVFVEGESGLGKSVLAAEFAQRLAPEHAGALVLASRCYENERLTLKAFDGAIDQLAALLRTMPLGACEEVMPKRAAILAQIFPVLGSVLAIAKAPKKGLAADPVTRRRQALDAFVELLERLSTQHRLVLLIDDLQWADPESLRLMATLSGRASALPLLVVCTMRPRRDFDPGVAAELHSLLARASSTVIELHELDVGEAAELSRALLGDKAAPELLRRLGEESNGHPLLLRELVRHVRSGEGASGPTIVSLVDAARERLLRLDAQTRRLTALVALAGRPYSSQVFAKAMGLDELPGESVHELLNQGLVRRRGEDELSCYHDHVRRATLANLSEALRAELSGELAAALESMPSSEPGERARLWDDANRPGQAIAALEAAGDAALEKLAFELADQHYARALELLGGVRDARYCRLASQRGHALVRLGKNAQAALLYQAAAEVATGEERVRLRVWAAQNLIQGARLEQGLSAAISLLQELGVPFPATARGALARITWESARLKLRGIDLTDRSRPLNAAQRLALDALNELSQPVASVMFLQGAALSIQHVRRALDAGEPAHAARALAYEGILRSTQRPQGDHSELFARARELAESTGDPAVTAAVEVRHGIACLARDDYRAARESLLRGHDIVTFQCPGQPWLLTAARVQLGATWYMLGQHKTLAAHSSTWVSDAKQRDDLYGYAALAGYGFGFLRHLMRDEPEVARSELAEALAPWPAEPFFTNQFGAILGTALSLQYMGGAAALSWLQENEARFAHAAILKNRVFRIALCNLYVAAHLGALDRAVSDERRRGIAAIRQQIAVLHRIDSPFSRAVATLWTSALTALSGDRGHALAQAQQAQRGLEERYTMLATVASYWVGWLEGGQSGRASCRETLLQVEQGGWKKPKTALSMIMPVFDLVSASP